jgi:hypothetical protein
MEGIILSSQASTAQTKKSSGGKASGPKAPVPVATPKASPPTAAHPTHPVTTNSHITTPTNQQLQHATKVIASLVSSNRPTKEEAEAWELIQVVLRTSSKGAKTTTDPEILAIKEDIKSLTQAVTKLTTHPPQPLTSGTGTNKMSYSRVLQKDLVLPSRRSRELVITLKGETIEEQTRTGLDLVRVLKDPKVLPSLEIIAARRLPSLDVALTFSTEKACKEWESKNTSSNIAIKARYYSIITTRFPRNLSNSPEELIQELQASNPRISLHITKASFLKKGLSTNFPRIPLVLSLKTPEEANLVCDKGLAYKGEFYDFSLFCGETRPKRCLNCQVYGVHIAKYCRSKTRCGYCGGTHSSQDCSYPKDQTKAYCIPCKARGHTAFADNCKSWRIELEKARQVYVNKPNRFLIQDSLPLLSHAHSLTSTNQSLQEDGFTVVKKRKKVTPTSMITITQPSLTQPTLPFPSSHIPQFKPRTNGHSPQQSLQQGSLPQSSLPQGSPPQESLPQGSPPQNSLPSTLSSTEHSLPHSSLPHPSPPQDSPLPSFTSQNLEVVIPSSQGTFNGV